MTYRFEDSDLIEPRPAGVPETIHLPCGGTAHFCYEAGYGHRCEDCMAVVGSIAQPSHCVDADKKYSVILKELGSNVRWNYNKGCEEEISEEDKKDEY